MVCCVLFKSSYSQSNFIFSSDKNHDKIKFELVNNLIVVPVKLNGKKLFFLLDTGVRETIIFNVAKVDSLQLNKASIIKVKGVNNESLPCIKSEENTLNIGNLKSIDQVIYVAFNQTENLSAYLGTEIHGILGYHFFKNFVVSVSYVRQTLKIFPKNTFKKKWKRYQQLPLVLKKGKPYIDANINNKTTHLLLDTGMSDSLWLFDDNNCEEYGFYEDSLGFTLSGRIEGKRSKIKEFKLKNSEFKDVKVAYPNQETLPLELKNKTYRYGIVGGEILKRFTVVLDYSNKKMFIKTNQWANDSFYYNRAGISLRQDGDAVERNKNNPLLKELESKNIISFVDLTYLLTPEFIIDHVRKNSPADKIGLQKEDVIIAVNGKKAYHYNLKTINALFYNEEQKKLKITVQRGTLVLEKELYLKSPLVKK